MSQRNTEAPRVVYEGKYQRMLVRGTWEYSERTHAGGLAAIIIAVTPEDNVLFVEQFRVPLQAPTIEMPAGLVGDIHAGESIEVSAVRELEEETGWTADHAEVRMVGPTSSGASSETCSDTTRQPSGMRAMILVSRPISPVSTRSYSRWVAAKSCPKVTIWIFRVVRAA